MIDELLYLDEVGPLTRAEILDLATSTTPRTIFPGRRIGRLQGGYEASFIVLTGNPLTDFENVRNVWSTVKAGNLIAGSLD